MLCTFGLCSLGSNDTHRGMIARYARDLDGAVFSVSYRLAPQYPWPCGIHDLLATYLYMISPSDHPPPSQNFAADRQTTHSGHTNHSAPSANSAHSYFPGTGWGLGIDPSNIVLSGDSAGGGMILALLQVLRDTGTPMPAGAALISPWSDLTHSFPSIMPNLKKDYIPPGFVHKPSLVWPAPKDDTVATCCTRPKSTVPSCGHAFPRPTHAKAMRKENSDASHNHLHRSSMQPVLQEDKHLEAHRCSACAAAAASPTGLTPEASKEQAPHRSETCVKGTSAPAHEKTTLWLKESFEPTQHLKDSEVVVPLDAGSKGKAPKEFRYKDQVQIYATNRQLIHPLVSPALAASLGGLPPLYILAGNNEALRDEIIWVAHRAAYPDKYPLPPHLARKLHAPYETARRRFDCVPTQVHLQVWDDGVHVMPMFSFVSTAHLMYDAIASFCKAVTGARVTHLPPLPKWEPDTSGPPDGTAYPDDGPGRTKFPYSKEEPLKRPTSDAGMVRERVSVHGVVRPMEPEHLLSALTVPRDRVGVIQAGPAKMFIDANQNFARKFHREPKRIARERSLFRLEAESALRAACADAEVVRGVKVGLRNRNLNRLSISAPDPLSLLRPPPLVSPPSEPKNAPLSKPSKMSSGAAARARRAVKEREGTTPIPLANSEPLTISLPLHFSSEDSLSARAHDTCADGYSTLATSPLPASSSHPGSNVPLDKVPHDRADPSASNGSHVELTYTPLDIVGETPPPSALVGRRDTPAALDLLRLGIEEVRRRGQALRRE